MKKQNYSPIIQKHKKQNISQKSLSLSKFNPNDSKITTNSKRDYFDLLTQIKNQKEKLGPPPTLFHYFIKKNAQKSIYIRLSYLAKRENHPSLFMDNPNTNQKNTSFPKASFNISLRDKNILTNSKRKETPKLPVNRILKLDDGKKTKIKPLKTKKYIPIERRDSYKNFINKMNQYNYMKYSNSNSDYVHKINTEIYLTQGNEAENIEKRRNEKYLQYMRDKFEEGKELNDTVFTPPLDLEKLKKKIRDLLTKEYEKKPETFFKSFVNRVNFLQDTYTPPNIKNNLINSKYKELYGFEHLYGLDCLNRISKNTLKNLSKVKIRKQREKEIKMNFLKQKGKITQKYLYYKKLSSNNIYNSKEEIEKIIYKDYYIKQEDWERILNDEKIVENYEDIDEFKNYFIDKYENNREAFIPDRKIKNCIFHLFKNSE